MATVTNDLVPFVTFGQLLATVRGIPAERVRLTPTPGTATEQDVIDVHDKERVLCELIDGVLVEKTVGLYESVIAVYIVTALSNFVDEHDLGIVAGADGMLRLLKGQVRIPDAAFISWNQLPERRIPRQPIARLYPDLAVEVLSKGNTKEEMDRKTEEYFTAGTRLMWIVDPPTRTVKVLHSPTDFIIAEAGDTLDGGDVLPGFTLSLERIFKDRP